MNSRRGTEKEIEEVETAYGNVSFFSNDQFLGRSLREYGEWAKKELDFIGMLIEPGAIVIDAGAYIGTHSMAFSDFVGSEGEVYSFEPHPTYFKLLRKNREDNQLLNVHLHNQGLSVRPGKLWVHDVNVQETNSFGSVKLEAGSSNNKKLAVDITTIDSLELKSCSFIKVDVEGMEKEVLAGGQKTIQQFKPFVYAECNSADDAWPVAQLMREFGYKIYLYSEIAFNCDNYRNNPVNIFNDARELALVCVPSARDELFTRKLNRALDIIPINQLDDLVIALVKKPQYKQEVLAHTSGAKKWGNKFWANENELKETNRQIGTVTETNDQLRTELKKRGEEAQKQIDALTEWATTADAHAKSLADELAKIQEDARKEINSLTKRASSAELHAKSLVDELAKAQEAFVAEASARENERDEVHKQIDALTEWATTADAHGKSLADELAKTQEDARKEINSLTKRASSAELHAKSLADELAKTQEDARKEINSLTKRASSAELYAKSLVDELDTLKAHWLIRFIV